LAGFKDGRYESAADLGDALGPRLGAYTLLVKGGQRRPADNMDTFEGTPLGQVAENLLAPVERLLKSGELTKAMQKDLIRALRSAAARETASDGGRPPKNSAATAGFSEYAVP
jgi:hypothetical protein